jgi:hypothetical protein
MEEGRKEGRRRVLVVLWAIGFVRSYRFHETDETDETDEPMKPTKET